MRIFVLTANYELRVSRKSLLRDHPTDGKNADAGLSFFLIVLVIITIVLQFQIHLPIF
jgi:hypothetical protein